MSKDILAAGTVCWRRVTSPDGSTQVMVLLIHRTKQKDVSFPKGKLDPGESMPEAALRETWEETGLSVTLGSHLGTIRYDISGGNKKTVQYWAAEVTPEMALASTFTPNAEVQALEWVALEAARTRLSYQADRELYDVFLKLAAHRLLDTFSVILLRHAKAEPRSEAFPEDSVRPLAEVGTVQAATIAPMLEAFGPRRIYSSTAERCLSTVAPLSEHLDCKVHAQSALSQDHWDTGDLADLRKLVGKIASRRESVVVCTHRPVLPDLVRELMLATSSLPGKYVEKAAAMPPAGFSIFHISRTHPGAGILSIETYPLVH